MFEICSDYFNNQTEIDEWKIGNLKILQKNRFIQPEQLERYQFTRRSI